MPAMDMPGSLSNPLAPSRKIRKAYKTLARKYHPDKQDRKSVV